LEDEHLLWRNLIVSTIIPYACIQKLLVMDGHTGKEKPQAKYRDE
jgi:hypothetical protein